MSLLFYWIWIFPVLRNAYLLESGEACECANRVKSAHRSTDWKLSAENPGVTRPKDLFSVPNERLQSTACVSGVKVYILYKL